MAKKKPDVEDALYDMEDVIKGMSNIKKELLMIRKSLLVESKLAFTNQDMMEMFDVGVKTLKKWRDSGDLGFTIKGSIYLYTKKDVQEFLQKNHYKLFDDRRSYSQIITDDMK